MALPPIRLAILVKPPVMPVTVPPSTALITQVLARLSAVRLFTPSPPLRAPLSVPPLSTKLSVPAPPVKVWMFTKLVAPAVVAMLPASAPVSVHVALPTEIILFAPVPPSIAVAPVS